MKNTLKAYFQKQNRTIDRLLNKPSSAFTADDFHKLRVEIKKEKALFKFVNWNTPEFRKTEVFRPNGILFKGAGKIRELQVEEDQLKKIGKGLLTNYRRQLRLKQVELRKQFFKETIPAVKKKLAISRTEALPYLEKSREEDMTRYNRKKQNKIEKLLKKKEIKTKSIHELRKQLKTLYYNRKIAGETEDLGKTKKLQELIGSWHDKSVLGKQLKKAKARGMLDMPEKKQLVRIRSQVISDKKKLRKKINENIAEKYA